MVENMWMYKDKKGRLCSFYKNPFHNHKAEICQKIFWSTKKYQLRVQAMSGKWKLVSLKAVLNVCLEVGVARNLFKIDIESKNPWGLKICNSYKKIGVALIKRKLHFTQGSGMFCLSTTNHHIFMHTPQHDSPLHLFPGEDMPTSGYYWVPQGWGSIKGFVAGFFKKGCGMVLNMWGECVKNLSLFTRSCFGVVLLLSLYTFYQQNAQKKLFLWKTCSQSNTEYGEGVHKACQKGRCQKEGGAYTPPLETM